MRKQTKSILFFGLIALGAFVFWDKIKAGLNKLKSSVGGTPPVA